MNAKKLALLAALGLALAAFFAFDLQRFLTLDQLKAAQGGLRALHDERPLWVFGVFFAVYVLATALSVPGSVVLTLAAGAVFGLVAATVLVSFASTLGATLAMLMARYLLRDGVRARFGRWLGEVDKGMARDGAMYLLTLRLVPLVPFFAINLVMGLTAMRARTYYWVSQLGMLPATLVYVNAGTQLARIESPQDVLSPGLIGSFVLIGLFPLAARRIADAVKARRRLARWAGRRPRRFDRNLVVIGAGAAGLVTAYIAATVKARVTLVEAKRMGGDCLNHGCVPSKALIRSATLARQMRRGAEHGIACGEVRVDFAQVMQRVARVVREIAPHDSVERYTALGVDVALGHATIVDPWHVQIRRDDGSTQLLATRSIVIATGARPWVPPLPGLDEVGCLTSDTLWGLRELPRRLLVLGGGPVGCELAQALARLGSQVTLVEQAPRLLAREDEEVSAHARRVLEADGVTVLAGHRALRCERLSGTKTLIAEDAGGATRTLHFDELLCAVGRVARLEGFGLEALGIPVQGTVVTDEYLQTVFPHILAAGDVAGPWQLTHVAAHQAWHAAVNGLLGGLWRFRVDYSVVPRCVFIDPEIARVGLDETMARAQGVPHEVTRYGIDELDRAIADGSAEGWVKVLTVPGRDRILGVTIVGAHAGELIAEFVLAMKHGLGLNKILGTMHAYPTLAEANKYAAGAWRRAHAPQRLLRWAERFHAWRRG